MALAPVGVFRQIPLRNELDDDPAPRFNYYRASGQTCCAFCGEAYYDHPVVNGKERRANGCELHVLCNTDRVKL